MMEVECLLYVYNPKSEKSKCPRQDVIDHFRKLLSPKIDHGRVHFDGLNDERGAIVNYRLEKSIFHKGRSFRGIHGCEGKCDLSSDASDHLISGTNFATNTLIVHYLEEHWSDIAQNSKHLDCLNRYLSTVGLKPIILQ